MSSGIDWDAHYQSGTPPWETGHPSTELERVITAERIQPCRVIELGCGSGINAVWLAQQGFDVTALDFNDLAIEQARRRGAAAGVAVRWLLADVCNLAEPLGQFPFFFDRGCYHAVRKYDLPGYLRTLQSVTGPGSLGLVLTGNARQPVVPGPPVVSEAELRSELGAAFEIMRLREFQLDTAEGGISYLGWSCLVQRPAAR